jgi:hypothetical protein
MIRHVMWTMLGATVAVLLGAWCDLYQLGDPQVWIAAAIGGALGLISYGGPVEPSLVERSPLPQRTSGALSFTPSLSRPLSPRR